MHGRIHGDAYREYLGGDEYLVQTSHFSKAILDRISFTSNLGRSYVMTGNMETQPQLGHELAYLTGYTHDTWMGTLRVSDIALYYTGCF